MNRPTAWRVGKAVLTEFLGTPPKLSAELKAESFPWQARERIYSRFNSGQAMRGQPLQGPSRADGNLYFADAPPAPPAPTGGAKDLSPSAAGGPR